MGPNIQINVITNIYTEANSYPLLFPPVALNFLFSCSFILLPTIMLLVCDTLSLLIFSSRPLNVLFSIHVYISFVNTSSLISLSLHIMFYVHLLYGSIFGVWSLVFLPVLIFIRVSSIFLICNILLSSLMSWLVCALPFPS